jgi:membrane protein
MRQWGLDVMAVLVRTASRFGASRGPLFAAAVAFYAVLSLVPLLLLALWGIGLATGADGRQVVFRFVGAALPGAPERALLEGAVEEVLARPGRLGLWAVAGLALSASGGFAVVQDALNAIWAAPPRTLLRARLRTLGVLLLIAGLLIVSLVLSAFLGWVARTAAVPAPGRWTALGVLLLLTASMFTTLYKYLPNTRTEWRPCLTAGVLAAILWEVAKAGFAWLSASRWGDRSATYGALAGYMGLLLSVYVSSFVLLLGGQLAEALQRPKGES